MIGVMSERLEDEVGSAPRGFGGLDFPSSERPRIVKTLTESICNLELSVPKQTEVKRPDGAG